MSGLDLAAVGGLVVLGAAFALGRFGELLFVALGAAVVVGAVVVAAAAQAPAADKVVLVAGLAAWFFGLGVVRVMAHRSVSLRLLARTAAGRDEDCGEEIRGRLIDIDRYGLVSRRNGAYGLSAAGRLLAALLAVLYRVSQVDR